MNRSNKPSPGSGTKRSPYLAGNAAVREFVNPYTFVPTPPREGAMADREPTGHDAVGERCYSGHLLLRIEALTPILLPDQARPVNGGEGMPAFPMRRDPAGNPILTGSTIKGVLRSAYEAITASRFGVFNSNQYLPFRVKDVNPDLMRWGVVVSSPDEGKVRIRVAKRYEVNPSVDTARFGLDRAVAVLSGRTPDPRRVVQARADDGEPLADNEVRGVFRQVKDLRTTHWIFIPVEDVPGNPGRELTVPDEVVRRYRDVIRHQQGTSEGQPVEGRPHVSDELGEAYLNLARNVSLRVQLASADEDETEIRDLRPAAKGATVTNFTPYDLAPAHVLPPTSLAEFSPAERLFGGVTLQAGEIHADDQPTEAYRGHLRFRQATVTSYTPRQFNPPLPLGPLSSPRLMPPGFYFGDRDQRPADIKPEKLKPETHRIRGRKVYMTHRAVINGKLGEEYWNPEAAAGDATREYIANPEASTNVRSTIKEWIPPGTTFEARIDLDSAPHDDLVPFMWLVSVMGATDQGHGSPALQIGLGKPFGFGAVKVTMPDEEACDTWSTADLVSRWTSVNGSFDTETYINEQLWEARKAYMVQVNRNGMPPVRSFLHASSGHPSAPVHYPKVGSQTGPIARGYEWFTKGTNMLGEPGATLKPPQPK